MFRLEPGEWPKLLQFGLFGFLLQMGLGVGFSAGDAAFLSNVGADRLPVIFLLTPAVMLIYTGLFSYLMVRFSIDHMVDLTLAMLIAGGAILWALLDARLGPAWETALYYVLKLYLAMWFIAIYSLFWNYTDAYFDIQDAKRLFPLFAAFCALGTATGAMIVSLFADAIPMHAFLLVWSAIAFATAPLARLLRRRWRQIAESDVDDPEDAGDARAQLRAVAKAFRISRYTVVLAATLFVTLLLTNLAEFQYSTVLQEGRSEAQLAALFGKLYATSNIFNLIVCLFVFNRLVARFGVRNVAMILPLSYFAAFGYFFMEGGAGAAIAAFFVYHGVLTSIEYNNQNLLFNAVPSAVKRPLRTVVEGMCEPLASFVAGGFLLLAATGMDMRELSGIGVIIGAVLIAIVIVLRQLYPGAMAANMRLGWLNFGDRDGQRADRDGIACELRAPGASIDRLVSDLDSGDAAVSFEALSGLTAAATPDDIHLVAMLATRLPTLSQDERRRAIALLGRIADTEAIPEILAVCGALAPRDRRAIVAILTGLGETAVPRLMSALRDRALPHRVRAVAARALAEVSYAQFNSQVDQLVREELHEALRLFASTQQLAADSDPCPALALLARAQRERVGISVDFTLELLALAGLLPNFDLLIVSLHSANAKVRGNAIEAIASGLDHARFRLLEPLLSRLQTTAAGALRPDAITEAVEQALANGSDIEAAAAAQVLHDRLEPARFAARVHDAIRSGISPVLREQILRLLGLDRGDGLTKIALVAALTRNSGIGGASLDALLALADFARCEPPAEPSVRESANGVPFWITYRDLHDVAARFPDLALVMLKSRDERPYAA